VGPGGLLLDVVVRQGAPIFQLLASKDQTLLVWGNALLVLDFGLHVLNGVTGFHLKGDGLAGQSLDEDLHTTTETQHKMEGGLLLDVVVGQGAPIFQLLASKDQTLLVWGNALLVLDFGLHVLNGVTGFHLKGDGLAGQSLGEDLHTTTETQHKMEGGLLLDVVVRQGASHLPAACQQRSDAAGQGECPPCPGFWPSRSQWCHWVPPQG
ncbi:hypothetical protein AALO_G00165030, partial [Alosa alosa]